MERIYEIINSIQQSLGVTQTSEKEMDKFRFDIYFHNDQTDDQHCLIRKGNRSYTKEELNNVLNRILTYIYGSGKCYSYRINSFDKRLAQIGISKKEQERERISIITIASIFIIARGYLTPENDLCSTMSYLTYWLDSTNMQQSLNEESSFSKCEKIERPWG